MNLLGNDDELLEKYNEKWDKIEKLFKTKLIVKQCVMINTLKLKWVYIIWTFMITNCLKKMNFILFYL